MDIKTQIANAISAHSLWKMRIRQAIQNQHSDWLPGNVRKDNQCEFGQWLYSLEDTSSSHYQKVKRLHADFHRVAADILELALAGKKDEALASLNLNGQYDDISKALARELEAWKDAS